MKFFDRLKIATNKTAWDKYISDFLSGNDYVNSTGDINVSGNSALKFTAVFSVLRVLAETFASVPVFEYQKKPNGDREKTDQTGWYDILHNVFNDEMSAFNGKEMSMYQVNLGGNAVLEKIMSRGGDPVALYPYEWNRIDIDRCKTTKRIEYSLSECAGGSVLRKLYRPDVLHVPGPSLNGIVGMSPLEYAAQAVKLGLTYEKFAVNFYKNGAIPSGIFEHPGAVGDESYKRLKESLKKEYTNLHNTGTPMLLEDGMQYKQLTMKLADAELLSSKKFQIEDICRIYRVPLHLVQNLDRATNNNIEHQSLEFVMYTMLPYFKRWEDCINTQLLTKEQRRAGYYFEFNMSSLLRGDQKSMAEAFAQGRQWGWLSVNDIRKLMNMNKIENGDIYLQPMNMIEAGTQVIEDQSKKILEEVTNLIERGK